MTTSIRNRPLNLQPLETRDVPSAWMEGSSLRIEGNDGSETITVRYAAAYDLVDVAITDHSGGWFGAGTVHYYFAPDEIQNIEFHGHGGNDSFTNEFILPSGGIVLAEGGTGNDRLQSVTPSGGGVVARVVLRGGNDNDVLIGSAGRDQLEGGSGHDTVYGLSGDDSIWGGDGNDSLRGDGGFDLVRGEAGDDVLFGGADPDVLLGGTGSDAIFGEGGGDTIYGDDSLLPAGNDWIDGGDGHDYLDAGDGNDLLQGGRGADALWGGSGDDRLDGGDDSDVDFVHLGSGADTLVARMYSGPPTWVFGPDEVRDFDWSEDRLEVIYVY